MIKSSVLFCANCHGVQTEPETRPSPRWRGKEVWAPKVLKVKLKFGFP